MENQNIDKIEEILFRYYQGKVTNEEYQLIVAWSESSEENKKLIQQLYSIYLATDIRKVTKQVDTEKALHKVSNQIAIRKKSIGWKWIQYAAAILFIPLLVTIGLLLRNNKSEYHSSIAQIVNVRTNPGMITSVVLPDSSIVYLNSESSLSYPLVFDGKTREVHLIGEAYFEVTKNRHKPFTVQSDAMRVRVLGTTFNFKSDKSCRVAEATLIEGEIEVKGNNDEGMVILSPGQKAELNRTTKRLIVKQVDSKLDAVWHDNLIPFEKADIYGIVKTLERFYDVKIILAPDIKIDNTYSGVLKRKDSIESVLNSLKNSIPIDYKIVGNNIFISAQSK